MKKFFILFFLCFLGLSCVKYPKTYVMNYDFIDIPNEKRIKITYTNNYEFTVCVSEQDWPCNTGDVHFGSELITLIVDNNFFPIRNINMGYCSDCVLHIAPGETINAFIPYENFGLPKKFENLKKQLKYPIGVYKCQE